MKSIEVPGMVRQGEVVVITSLSGGKDSTAAFLALREAGVASRLVFADTGWEAAQTYEHLRGELAAKLGPIDWVGVAGGMLAKIRHRAGFPARMQRWCTRELKVAPLRAYHDRIAAEDGRETVSVLGIRAEESAVPAQLPIWEDSDEWGGWVWRPIRDWTVADVLAIHHRHGVAVNPLYRLGHERVGCFPCIYARKEEICLVAEHAPERIAEIDALEREVTEERARRNTETPGRYAHPGSRHTSRPARLHVATRRGAVNSNQCRSGTSSTGRGATAGGSSST